MSQLRTPSTFPASFSEVEARRATSVVIDDEAVMFIVELTMMLAKLSH